MYVCERCKKAFENPLRIEEYRGECHGTPAYENVFLSPCCRDSYKEADLCIGCNRYVAMDELLCGYCAACQAEILRRFCDVMGQFNSDERQIISELTEGKPL